MSDKLTLEIWKPVNGWEENYSVSNFGRIKNRFGRLLKLQKTEEGRICVVLNAKPNSKKYLVHRLVGIAFMYNPNNKPEINHLDGDPTNNKVNNLEWSTHSENMLHAYRNGLTPYQNKSIKIEDLQTGSVHEFASIQAGCAYIGIVPSMGTYCLKTGNAAKGRYKLTFKCLSK